MAITVDKAAIAKALSRWRTQHLMNPNWYKRREETYGDPKLVLGMIRIQTRQLQRELDHLVLWLDMGERFEEEK
jgi:hypothetical protein